MSASFRQLPSVTEVLERSDALVSRFGHGPTVEAIRLAIADLRSRLQAGELLDGAVSPDAVAAAVTVRLDREERARLRPVINATGIVLHTNLGRAPMAESAARAAYDAARGYTNLEMDLASGERSKRSLSIRPWLVRLTGAESATAVNNCAGATVLVLRALAADREVIVSRGQLIEIGGSFRIPEIMAVSGAILREVGTTNITRVGDYERAIGPNTALLMRIHQSNYRIHGFTDMPALSELVELGRRTGIPVIDDIGSGAMFDLNRFGLSGEPVARESIAAGADLVLFSGDKLLGGPQAGIIAGRQALIEQIERDPLMRALRLDKMSLAALEATLRLYVDVERACEEVPTLKLLTMSAFQLRARCDNVAEQLAAIPGIHCRVLDVEAFAGGGSLPDQALHSAAIAVRADAISDDELSLRLRLGTPAVVGRVRDGEFLLDLRTVFPDHEGDLIAAVARAVKA